MSSACLRREIKRSTQSMVYGIGWIITQLPKAILAFVILTIPYIIYGLFIIITNNYSTTRPSIEFASTFVIEALWYWIFAMPIVNCYVYPSKEQENAPAGS